MEYLIDLQGKLECRNDKYKMDCEIITKHQNYEQLTNRTQRVEQTSTSLSDSSDDEPMNHTMTPFEKRLQRKIERLTKENLELKHMLFTRIPRLLTAVERVNYVNQQSHQTSAGHGVNNASHMPSHGEIPNTPGQLTSQTFHEWDDFCSRYVRQSVPTLPNDEQVEIFPGSGVLVSRTVFYNAQQCCNSNSYVRALVQAVFPKSVLVRSNLRGGKSKTPVGMPQPPTSREKLDPVRLEAIYNAVFERFPGVKRGKLGICVNNYICGLRYRTRKKISP